MTPPKRGSWDMSRLVSSMLIKGWRGPNIRERGCHPAPLGGGPQQGSGRRMQDGEGWGEIPVVGILGGGRVTGSRD